jgi:cell wall-associated NlpC family hydrolase
MFVNGPGVVILDRHRTMSPTFSALGIGDLVFFDADPEDHRRLDHVGMYLGPDAAGHHRFISSRKGHNGPTLGDIRGRSVLDGRGLNARTFQAARRL